MPLGSMAVMVVLVEGMGETVCTARVETVAMAVMDLQVEVKVF